MLFVSVASGDAFAGRYWFFDYLKQSVEIRTVGTRMSFNLPLRSLMLRTVLDVFSALRSLREYDVVVSVDLVNATFLEIARRILGAKNTHVIIDTVGSYYLTQRKLWTFAASKLFVDAVVVCQFEYLTHIWRRVIKSYRAIHYIDLGADQSQLKGTTSNKGYIYSEGRSNRDFRSLVKACTDGIDMPLYICGWGKVLEELRETGGNSEIHIYDHATGPQQDDLLRNCAFVVVPLNGYLPPAGGTTVRRAMAAGKAVIATHNADVDCHIQNGVEGLLYRAGDVATLNSCVKRLSHNSTEIARFGLNARRKMADRSYGMSAKRFWQILTECVQR
ncbi:MAG: glycosyltransferase [Nitrososphaerota archaeon]|nr:glycosyltransferase [Nitrososphaerota archaeon]